MYKRHEFVPAGAVFVRESIDAYVRNDVHLGSRRIPLGRRYSICVFGHVSRQTALG